jgi:GNAT superfamily N-acetyltransferase
MESARDWKLVPYEPSKRQAVLDLMARVQDHPTPEAEFVWWFEENPTKYLNIFLAELDGRVIGVSSTNSFRIWCDGAEHLIPFSLNVLTHPDHRGRGIFSRLELANEADARHHGCPFMLSFPNRRSTPIFVRKLGWSAGWTAPLVTKAASPRRLLARLLGARGLLPSSRFLWRLTGPTFHRRRPGAVEAIGEFDTAFDRLWEQEREERRWGFVRDSAYLNWRYVEAPSQRYQCFRISDGADLAGYLVTGVIEKRGLRLGYVADLFLRARSRRRLADGLAAVDAQFFAQDVDAVLALGVPGLAERHGYSKSFYWPTPKRFPFIYKVFDPRYARLPFGERSRWTFTLGDLDFF